MNNIEQAKSMVKDKDQRIVKLVSPSGQVSYKVYDKKAIKYHTKSLVQYRGFEVEIIPYWVKK
jgi:hypothetical protein